MRRSITSLALAAIALLVVTASVAAADPFGWGRHGTTGNPVMSIQNAGWMQNGTWPSQGPQTSPATATPITVARPTAAPATSQNHPSPTLKPSRSTTTTHHSTTTRSTTQSTWHGDDWCDDYGRGDHDSGDWH